jgi:hypothetical protein
MPWAALSAEVAREFSELTTPGGVGMEELHWREWRRRAPSPNVCIRPGCGVAFTPKRRRNATLCSNACRLRMQWLRRKGEV